jgi:hypothetical protein
MDLSPFRNLELRGGFVLSNIHLSAQPLLDPIERSAIAETVIRGNRFEISLRADLDEREISISLYHEVLEAATVAALFPPQSVLEFNEGDFEQAAQGAYNRFGPASPQTLNTLLAEFGF